MDIKADSLDFIKNRIANHCHLLDKDTRSISLSSSSDQGPEAKDTRMVQRTAGEFITLSAAEMSVIAN